MTYKFDQDVDYFLIRTRKSRKYPFEHDDEPIPLVKMSIIDAQTGRRETVYKEIRSRRRHDMYDDFYEVSDGKLLEIPRRQRPVYIVSPKLPMLPDFKRRTRRNLSEYRY